MSYMTMNRSTLLADLYGARKAPSVTRVGRAAPSIAPSVVRVGAIHIGIGPRTLVGNPGPYAYGMPRVGQTMSTTTVPTGSSTSSTSTVTTTTEPSSGLVSGLKTVAGWALVASFIAGPPAVGYLLFGKIGLAVGAIVAAPVAILAVAAIAGNAAT